MNESRLNTVAQLSAFLNGTFEVNFYAPASDRARYAFIGTVRERFAYAACSAPIDGWPRYLERTAKPILSRP